MDMSGRWNRFKQRMLIIGPPLLLLAVGAATYITVVKLTQSDIPVLSGMPGNRQASESASEVERRQSQALTTINTKVVQPTSTTISIWQSEVTAGRNQWRTDPLQVAKRMAMEYGFENADPFSLEESSSASRIRDDKEVMARHNGKDYKITLIQPGVSGPEGVWVIQSIQEVDD